MIKVQISTNCNDDVCNIIENSITDGMEFDKWITAKIKEISFECMDYPYDIEYCYDCYFRSNADKIKAYEIYNMFKLLFQNNLQINFKVWITDELLNEIQEIM